MVQWDIFTSFTDSAGRPLARVPDMVRPGTTAAIFNERGEILLEKRADNGLWGMPGGAVDIGESVERSVIREVQEETGLLVRVKRLVGVYSDPRLHTISAYPNGDVVHYVTICFECEKLSGELRVSEESTDLKYFSTDALPKEFLLPHRQRIADVLARSPEPFIR